MVGSVFDQLDKISHYVNRITIHSQVYGTYYFVTGWIN